MACPKYSVDAIGMRGVEGVGDFTRDAQDFVNRQGSTRRAL
jgi:hypothetical protein